MLTDTAVNTALDAITLAYLSAHTAYSTTGANEVTGGSPAYARKAVTFAAAATRSRAASTQPVFDIPAGTTVRWIGKWSALAGTFHGMSPNGGSDKAFIADVTNDKILCPAHGYSAGQTVVFYGGTAPTGLTAGTVYYVVNPTTDDFQVAATAGGAAINITGQAASGCLVSKIVEEAFAAQGTLQINSHSITLP